MKSLFSFLKKKIPFKKFFFYPVRLLYVYLGFTFMLVIISSWGLVQHNMKSYSTLKDLMEFQEFVGKVEFLDEATTMSTYMGVTSGDQKWEQRHEKYEKMREETLSMLPRFTKKVCRGKCSFDVKNILKLKDELALHEKQAYQLVRKGEVQSASDLLDGTNYWRFKKEYSDEINKVRQTINSFSDDRIRAQRKSATVLIMLGFLLMGLLFLMWYRVVAMIKRLLFERKLVEKEIHERKLREHEAEKAKSQHFSHMSHAVRTPLSVILGYSDILLEPNLSPERKNDARDTIHRNGVHLISILDEMLELSRLESGGFRIERMPFSLLNELWNLCSLFKVKVNEKGLNFRIYSEGPIPVEVTSNQHRFHQILLTLLNNAVQFTQTGSVTVTIRLSYLENIHRPKLELLIRDTGVGMNFEERKRIFIPFSQGYIPPGRKSEGTGLGLVLSQKLAKHLGGDLVLLTSQKNKGSVFKFTLDPGDIGETRIFDSGDFIVDKTLEQGGVSHAKLGLENAQILIVEDDADSRVLFKHFLSEAGAKVETASNGAEAVDKALFKKYDVIFMDIALPELDGPQATRYLRQKNYTGPIIALSAHTMQNERGRCIEAGCDEYLSKPVDSVSLIRTAERFYGRMELRQENSMSSFLEPPPEAPPSL